VVKHDANHTFMSHGQIANFMWCYHVPGTDLHSFSGYWSYTQTNL